VGRCGRSLAVRGPDPAHGSSALGASALTGAELRLLPLLPTHLSFSEIAAEVFLSPNTVKSTVHSIYRKLRTSSRSQAVSRLRDLGLLVESQRALPRLDPA
jgi:LuxR family transcriptional regulator, maltose regulon positive regulatory protein